MVANLKTVAIYCGILTLENVGTVVMYHNIFKTLATGGRNWKLIYLRPRSKC
jgi:hypothetical protein